MPILAADCQTSLATPIIVLAAISNSSCFSHAPSLGTPHERSRTYWQEHILMIVGDFVEDYEAMVPLQILLVCRPSGRDHLPGQGRRRNGGHGHS